jgi:hypothetical protein
MFVSIAAAVAERFLCVVSVLVLFIAGCRPHVTPSEVRARAPKNWSIGIVRGPSLDSLQPDSRCSNPRVTAQSIASPKTDFVADPFLIRDGERWLLFFELFNAETGKGEIGLSESSDLCEWKFVGVVVREVFHLSYPLVFKIGKEYFMVPESRQAGSVRLYHATRFPSEWRFVRELVRGNYSDATPVRFKRRWWLFANRAPYALTLFSARSIWGAFSEHPVAPLYQDDESRARPAGRPVVINGELFRFVQDNRGGYGKRVRAMRVRDISECSFIEEVVWPDPLLSAGDQGWNSYGMHHISPVRLHDGTWVAAVDGNQID